MSYSFGVKAQTTLSADTSVSTAGYFQLKWDSDTPASYELEQASDQHFTAPKRIYVGYDNASVLSGLPDGDYYYRARVLNEPWSEVVHVKVQHHSMSRALTFFTLGILMFLILISILLLASKQEAKQ